MDWRYAASLARIGRSMPVGLLLVSVNRLVA